jgi:ADP-ribosyl-[dinitrogen reductase] hydrolase
MENRMNPPLRERLEGTILGTAVGDALGMPLEFVHRERFEDKIIGDYLPGGAFNGPCSNLAAGQWTDDTQMMLVILESLLAYKKCDLEDIRKRFYRWATSDDQRFPGTASRSAALTGKPAESEGCGTIMRTLPLGFLVSADEAVAIAELTHIGENGGKWVRFLHEAVRRDIPFCRDFFVREHPGWNGGNGAWVVDTGMTALKAVIKADDFEEAVVEAVNQGGDTDSIGAVAGGLAGALFGSTSIPERYLEDLEKVEDLRRISSALAAVFLG